MSYYSDYKKDIRRIHFVLDKMDEIGRSNCPRKEKIRLQGKAVRILKEIDKRLAINPEFTKEVTN